MTVNRNTPWRHASLLGQSGIQPIRPAKPYPPRPYVNPYKIGPESFCISWDEHGKSRPCTLVPVASRPLRAEDV